MIQGYALGLQGTWNTTDCSNASYVVIYNAGILYTTTLGVFTG